MFILTISLNKIKLKDMIIGKNISLRIAFDFLLDKHLQKKKYTRE